MTATRPSRHFRAGASALALAAGLGGVGGGAALAGPEGGVVTRGAGAITAAGTTTTIKQQTKRIIIEWDGFDVKAEEVVRFEQPSASAVALNRVKSLKASKIDGKIKEPLLRLTQLWRAYDAASQSGVFPLAPAYIIFGQGPLQSPSVFNFFSPFYAPAGEIRNSGLVAPELQIATEYQNTFITNYMFLLAFNWNSAAENPGEDDVLIDISAEMAVADDTDALIDMVVGKLLGGQVSVALAGAAQGGIGDRYR